MSQKAARRDAAFVMLRGSAILCERLHLPVEPLQRKRVHQNAVSAQLRRQMQKPVMLGFHGLLPVRLAVLLQKRPYSVGPIVAADASFDHDVFIKHAPARFQRSHLFAQRAERQQAASREVSHQGEQC